MVLYEFNLVRFMESFIQISGREIKSHISPQFFYLKSIIIPASLGP